MWEEPKVTMCGFDVILCVLLLTAVQVQDKFSQSYNKVYK